MKRFACILVLLSLLLSACGSVGSFVDEEVQELKEIFGAKTEEVWTEEMAEEIAEAVCYFASDASAYTTGQILAVSGGFGLATPVYGDLANKPGKR